MLCGVETTKFCQRKKEFSFFRLSSQDCLQMAAVCCCFRSSFYSRIFDVFGDMLLVHFYSLGFWKSFVKEFMGPKKYLTTYIIGDVVIKLLQDKGPLTQKLYAILIPY